MRIYHHDMDKTKWPATIGLVAGTYLLTRTISSTFAFDKPIHTSIVILASAAAAISALSRFLPRDGGRSHKGREYDALPLEDVGQSRSSRQSSPTGEDVRYPSSLRKLRILFLILIATICLRAEVLREILSNTQCTILSPQTFIPFSLAFWDYVLVQRHKKRPINDDPDASVYDALEHYVTRTQYRYLTAALFVAVGCTFALASTGSPRSTYICAASLDNRWLVPNLQWLASSMDITIIYCIGEIVHQHEGRGLRTIALRFVSVAWAFLFSAIILLITGIVYFYITPSDRDWILTIPHMYLGSMLKLDLLVCFTAICALFSVHHVGILTSSLIVTFVSASTLTTTYSWNNPHPYPPFQTSLGFASLCLAILGFATYFHVETVSENQSSTAVSRATFTKVPSWFYLFLLILFFVRTGLWVSRTSSVSYHPIDMLIYEAQTQHEAYINQTSASKSLAEAVQTYRARYDRHPPPGYDEWYNYATARNSVIVDDYDSIYRDLLPFYALEPALIRQKTWDMISNPWNDAAGISIREGNVAISPNVVPTHRWMLDGIVEMISQFSKHLPDMDLAFNLNDEPRVVVPHEQIEQMRDTGRFTSGTTTKPRNTFSSDRGRLWPLIPDPPNTETPLDELSFQRTFHEFGSVGCPQNSPARTERLWDTRSLCISCSSPQSLGAFLANWTVAADICHQPDLANLHGLYISPAAFKGAHDLYPMFSQSKPHGFNDILYPSAWNYMNKAKYEPNDEFPDLPFSEKINSIFWRGATSEGVSPGMGQWKGMTRQRFIHMSNNINGTAAPQYLLLPPTSEPYKLAYSLFSATELSKLLSTDVHVVELPAEQPNDPRIARCGGRDCPQQEAEFAPLFPPTDFQAHWHYKYLLDLDGAGFSGRFLPFLYSRSLPFKAALFREWWDDRVTPWQHFVPLDIRGHGFWATLAYFAGIDGEVQRKRIQVEPHEMEGERIASRGRNWANKVLRKEDMEIYMFRLLLEWGRLTDDLRDSIGYDLNAE